MTTMQQQTPRVNRGTLVRSAIIVVILIFITIGVQRYSNSDATSLAVAQPPTDSQPVAVEQPVNSEEPTAFTLDALLSEAAALTVGQLMPPVDSFAESQIESQFGEQIYTNGSAECSYSILDALGLTNCEKNAESFMQRCVAVGYSADHCANRMQPGMEQATVRYAQPQAVSMARHPQRPTNYVPEYWPAEIRSVLQYPSGLTAQDWAN